MRNIRWKQKNGEEASHWVYTPQEAEEKGIQYKEAWRDGEEGDWVLTDDGYVVQILKRGRLNRSSDYYRTCIGVFPGNPKAVMDTVERECRWTLNGKSPEGAQKRTTPMVKQFAEYMASGVIGGKVDPAAIYKSLNPKASDRTAREKSQWLMRRKDVREIISREIAGILEKMGCSKEWLIEQLMEVAVDVDNAGARLGALRELASYHGLHEKKSTETTVKFKGIPQSSLDSASMAIEASHGPIQLPSETADEDLAKLIPRPESVDPDSVEASMEVTLEESGVGFEEDS